MYLICSVCHVKRDKEISHCPVCKFKKENPHPTKHVNKKPMSRKKWLKLIEAETIIKTYTEGLLCLYGVSEKDIKDQPTILQNFLDAIKIFIE